MIGVKKLISNWNIRTSCDVFLDMAAQMIGRMGGKKCVGDIKSKLSCKSSILLPFSFKMS